MAKPSYKPRRPGSAAKPPKLWRKNRISDWREAAGLTQQQVADRLTEAGLAYTRNSVGRVEAGKQIPSIAVLEAIAAILKAPSVSDMTDLTPAEAKSLTRLRTMDAKERERLWRIFDAATG